MLHNKNADNKDTLYFQAFCIIYSYTHIFLLHDNKFCIHRYKSLFIDIKSSKFITE